MSHKFTVFSPILKCFYESNKQRLEKIIFELFSTTAKNIALPFHQIFFFKLSFQKCDKLIDCVIV